MIIVSEAVSTQTIMLLPIECLTRKNKLAITELFCGGFITKCLWQYFKLFLNYWENRPCFFKKNYGSTLKCL